jgi:ribosome-associated protein
MRHVVTPAEVEFVAIRAQGPGGQNVNKVASAVQLRFDIAASSLPEAVKARLLATADSRISEGGVIVIKAQTARSQEQNKADALARLQELVDAASARRTRKPTLASRRRRLQAKGVRAEVKAGRAKIHE